MLLNNILVLYSENPTQLDMFSPGVKREICESALDEFLRKLYIDISAKHREHLPRLQKIPHKYVSNPL